MIGALSDALETGVRIGRQRRRPTASELARFTSQTLRTSFRRGLKRGRRLQAELEQQRLELTRGDG